MFCPASTLHVVCNSRANEEVRQLPTNDDDARGARMEWLNDGGSVSEKICPFSIGMALRNDEIVRTSEGGRGILGVSVAHITFVAHGAELLCCSATKNWRLLILKTDASHGLGR